MAITDKIEINNTLITEPEYWKGVYIGASLFTETFKEAKEMMGGKDKDKW